MAETLPAVDQARVAEAVARLLSRQAALLARAQDDAGAAGAARMGLAWLAELLRSLEVPGAAAWFQALRERSAAWADVGAPMCARLAEEVLAQGSLGPLLDDAADWHSRIAEVLDQVAPPDFVVPVPVPVPAPPVPPVRTAEPPAPAPVPKRAHPAASIDLGELPWRDDPRFAAVRGVIASGDPVALERLSRVLVTFHTGGAVRVETGHGRIELVGLSHGDAASSALGALDAAAREAGAVVLAAARSAQGVAWRVRLAPATGEHWLFVEVLGRDVAFPWSQVVEYGLLARGRGAEVVLGHGLRRLALPLAVLHGKGPAGTAQPAETPEEDSALPAGLAWAALITDRAGRTVRSVRVLEMAEPAAREPETREAPATPTPAPEPIQATEVPADNRGKVAPWALVADDSMMARLFLSRLLREQGIEVDEAEDGIRATALLSARAYDLVFLDVAMPGGGAFDIVEASGAALAARVCVLVKDEDERRRAEDLGLAPVLFKPFAEDEVAGAVHALLAARARSD